ncbi:MAG: NlpC/P60 family protein [Bacteroidales bacterium]|nr:NlpC/P60 family protein [Bacteroidales bacterium]
MKNSINKGSKIFFYLTLFLILASSCRTNKEVSRYNLDKKELSKVLNIAVRSKDNITLYREVAFWWKTPHRDGGETKSGIDCSFLAKTIYRNVYNKVIERNSNDILKQNCKQIKRKKLKEGDLVFFKTSKRDKNRVNHVGVYLKDNKFVHVSTSQGVIISSLDEDFYQKTWVCGGRVR